MKVLVAVLEDLGARRVKTYIQSGNAVFQGPEQELPRLSSEISREIHKRRGFEPQVLLLELDDFERAIRKNPFPEAASNPTTLHAGFLASAPQKPDLRTLGSLKSDRERFRLIDSVFYLHAPGRDRSVQAGRERRETARGYR